MLREVLVWFQVLLVALFAMIFMVRAVRVIHARLDRPES